MPTQTNSITLNATDAGILAELDENVRGTATLFANVIGVSRTHASQRVRRLREHGLVHEVAPNLYEITPAGEMALEAERR